jgi:hypothetical protein
MAAAGPSRHFAATRLRLPAPQRRSGLWTDTNGNERAVAISPEDRGERVIGDLGENLIVVKQRP